MQWVRVQEVLRRFRIYIEVSLVNVVLAIRKKKLVPSRFVIPVKKAFTKCAQEIGPENYRSTALPRVQMQCRSQNLCVLTSWQYEGHFERIGKCEGEKTNLRCICPRVFL